MRGRRRAKGVDFGLCGQSPLPGSINRLNVRYRCGKVPIQRQQTLSVAEIAGCIDLPGGQRQSFHRTGHLGPPRFGHVVHMILLEREGDILCAYGGIPDGAQITLLQ